jgi:hypothetical protein
MAASVRLKKGRLEFATRVFESGFQALSLQTLNKKEIRSVFIGRFGMV